MCVSIYTLDRENKSAYKTIIMYIILTIHVIVRLAVCMAGCVGRVGQP